MAQFSHQFGHGSVMHSKAVGHGITGGFAFSAPNNARTTATSSGPSTRSCTGLSPGGCLEQGDGSDRAIITPAPHRTLILVKVPCSTGEKHPAEARRIAANIAKLPELMDRKIEPQA